MKIAGSPSRSIWLNPDGWSVGIYDQRHLPWQVERMTLRNAADAYEAIADMACRGAPLIGAVAAYGLALALREDASGAALERAVEYLAEARPTAVNLRWALDRVRGAVLPLPAGERAEGAFAEAAAI
jgi:methylthioribose-1-phosphate isomerase